MPVDDAVRTDLRALLGAVEAASPVNVVAVLANELRRMVGAVDVSFLIADFSGDALIRFPSDLSSYDGDPAPAAKPGTEPLDDLATVYLIGSVYEKAMWSQQVVVEPADDLIRVYAPVTDRGDAIGVLELVLPATPDEEVLSFVASAAHALAYVIIANRWHTDLFERGQRNVPFNLAAEIQRRLLPAAFTCEAAEFTVACWLEPAHEIGGDTFDYSVEQEALHLTISDAKGHEVHAAQLATLAVSSLRNSRRARDGVAAQAQAANAAIRAYGADEDFVTALIVRIDLVTGLVGLVNAGHPAAHLVRDGIVKTLVFEADLPLGMSEDGVYREQTLTLRPGDRLVLVTDGMLERNATSLDIAAALAIMTELHPREVVHSFARAVLNASGGRLEDDATLLCVDWYGRRRGDGDDRVSAAGASTIRASDVADAVP
ncbi:MAG: PP2C family protein-serine/threonine phosphatase [Mycobacteriales bacterium]